MADEADVSNALVGMLAAALYPNGTAQPSAVTAACRVFRGWPQQQALETDLAAGTVNVSVYAQNGVERNTTRYPREWKQSIAPAPTITAAVAGNVVTLGGTFAAPQYVTIVVGKRHAYSFGTGASPADIATGLAALIAADFPGTTSSGPVLTIASTLPITARLGTTGTAWRELKRQERSFQITAWCSTPALRDTVISLLDVTLAKAFRFTLPDNSTAFMTYERSVASDADGSADLYRRDLFYWVEYATAETAAFPVITSEGVSIKGGVSPADSPTVNTDA